VIAVLFFPVESLQENNTEEKTVAQTEAAIKYFFI
jgi:hypothetical protein